MHANNNLSKIYHGLLPPRGTVLVPETTPRLPKAAPPRPRPRPHPRTRLLLPEAAKKVNECV